MNIACGDKKYSWLGVLFRSQKQHYLGQHRLADKATIERTSAAAGRFCLFSQEPPWVRAPATDIRTDCRPCYTYISWRPSHGHQQHAVALQGLPHPQDSARVPGGQRQEVALTQTEMDKKVQILLLIEHQRHLAYRRHSL